MVIHPTVDAGKSWSQEKLEPNIRSTPVLKKKIADVKSRDAKSTSTYKTFAGGFLRITGANSAAGLRQKSIKYMMKDDWDEWPMDIGGQGDPDEMANARQLSFHETGNFKCFEVSTPTIEAISRVTKAYESSDKRVYKVPCPHCGEKQELNFFPVSTDPFAGGLKFNKEAPYEAYYVCEHNGCIIEHFEKQKMLKGGEWVASAPGQGRHPGFKINAVYSPFTTWDIMVEKFLAAKDSPQKLKTFYNLWLGLAWKERGDAPDHKRLMTLREDYALRKIPLGALIVTVGIDVQKNGFYYEVVAWGPGKTNWSIDYGFLDGDTEKLEVWKKLDELYERYYENAYGQSFQADMVGIDANYIPHMVHPWVKTKPRAMATRGLPSAGPQTPICGSPSKQQVSYTGKKIKGGLLLWPIGTWRAKSEVYGCLRFEGVKEGKEENPIGYCHFTQQHDDKFFKQLTAESLVTRSRGGRSVTEWVMSRENHYLDCRVINLVCAERMRIGSMSILDWQKLSDIRDCPPEDIQGSLLSLQAQLTSTPTASVPPTKPTEMPNTENQTKRMSKRKKLKPKR
jgi:phage terminase large subunit GpA-like protein